MIQGTDCLRVQHETDVTSDKRCVTIPPEVGATRHLVNISVQPQCLTHMGADVRTFLSFPRNCRAINGKGMVFSNTWVYSKKDTLDIHTGWWSLVNYRREGYCETLYNVLMNINQMAIGLTAGRSDGLALMANRCINVIPRQKC